MPESGIDGAKSLFVRRWGEMAATWGIGRTMAEIHALLFLTTEPLCTDDVMEQLEVSRGSASMNLRELVNWGLIHRVHQRGDRKEYYLAETDVWQMFETITRERRRREVQPIVESIERCLVMVDQPRGRMSLKSKNVAKAFKRRLHDILEFCEVMNTLFNLVSKVGHKGLGPLGKKVAKLVG